MAKPYYRFKKSYKRFLAAFFDGVGSLLFLSHRARQTAWIPRRLDRILIIRNDHLGDVVMTYPAIKKIQRHFPNAKLDLLLSSESAPLFRDDPALGQVMEFKHHWFSEAPFFSKISEAWKILTVLRKGDYDLGIDFRGDLRNIILMRLAGISHCISYGVTGGSFLLSLCSDYPLGQHQVQVNQELIRSLGIIPQDMAAEKFSYPDSRKKRFLTRFPELLPQNHRTPRLVLHPAAGYPSKQWPQEYYELLIQKILREKLASVFLIGTQHEKEKIFFPKITSEKFYDLRGKTLIEDLPILFDLVDLYTGNDSGPAHLAALQGLPLIILFSGTNQKEIWHPWSKKLQLITHEVPCSPCEAKDCPLGHHDCMRKISVDEVFRTVEENLESIRKRSRFKDSVL